MKDEGVAALAPLRQPSAPLRQKIIATLRNAIETGALKPGARLVEKDLCEQLEVSRTSLREALRELQADGILKQASNRSLAVNAPTRQDADNAYRIRAVLEALIVEQFIENAGPADVKALVKESEALKAAYRAGVVAEMLKAKRAFHDRICAGAANPIAFDILSRLVLRTSSLRARSLARPARQNQSIEEIEALMEAILRRDVPAARKAAVRHVRHSAASAFVDTQDD